MEEKSSGADADKEVIDFVGAKILQCLQEIEAALEELRTVWADKPREWK
jgi:hypothetical protein